MRKLLLLLLLLCLPAMAAQASEQDRNKAVARGFFEDVLGNGHLDRYMDSHSADFVAHAGDRSASLEEDLGFAMEERKALPDMRVSVERLLAERDLVAVHWVATGTNTQAGMGFPATGKRVKVNGMTIFRFRAGKICEEWGVIDMLSAMRQAGLL